MGKGVAMAITPRTETDSPIIAPTGNVTMANAGFVIVKPGTKPPRRLIVSSRAKEKHGKTHFSLSMPDPLAYISYDMGDEGMIEKFVDQGRVIHRCELPKPTFRKPISGEDMKKREEAETKSKLAQYEEHWLRGRDAFEAAVNNKSIRSIIVDTNSEFYESIRLARLGKLTQVMPQHYGPVKEEFRGIMQLAKYRKDVNVIFIHKMKKEYKENSKGDSNWTGKWEMQGFDDMGYIAQVIITHLREPLAGGGVRFGIRIDDCRQNPDVIGLELWSDEGMCDFVNLAMCVYPDTNEGDWR
jgi:hypothetical protein